MPVNLGLQADLAAIKALPKNSPQWFPMVAAFLRKLLHSVHQPIRPQLRPRRPRGGIGAPRRIDPGLLGERDLGREQAAGRVHSMQWPKFVESGLCRSLQGDRDAIRGGQ